jgi:hypothetical protein
MHPHAGYAATVAVGQDALQGLIRSLYVAGRIQHTLHADTMVPFNGITTRLVADLFFDVPRLTLAEEFAGQYFLQLRAWGRVSINVPGVGQLTAPVLVSAGVFVDPQIFFNDDGLNFGLAAESATLYALTVTQIGGGPLPATVTTYLDSDDFKAAVRDILRGQLAGQGSASIPLDFLGKVGLAPQRTAAVRIFNGTLVIGIDVGWSDPLIDGMLAMFVVPPVTTHGRTDLMSDFRGDHDAAYCLNPNQLPIAFIDAFLQARDRADEQGATLERFHVAARPGRLHIAGTASATGGSLVFSFDAVPVLTHERIFKWRESFYFQVVNAHFDVVLDWWVRWLEAVSSLFTLGLAALSVEGLVNALTGGAAHALQGTRSQTAPRNQQLLLPGAKKPVIDLGVQTFKVAPDGLVAGLSLRPRLPKPRLSGQAQLLDGAAVVDGGPPRARLFYAVTLPVDVLRADPQLRIRWTLRRTDTGVTVDQADGAAARGRTYRVEVPFPVAQAIPPLRVECRVYRTLGGTVEEVFAGRAAIRTRPPQLDRSHPYVHWRRQTQVPEVMVDANGNHHRLGANWITRYSVLHRTDLPGRCLFADAGVQSQPEYLDELPFPRDEIMLKREQLCDYCFFGGPTGTVPLI